MPGEEIKFAVNEHLIDRLHCLANLVIRKCPSSWFKNVAKLVHKFRLTEFYIELETQYEDKPLIEETILDFLTKQKHLKTVDLSLIALFTYDFAEKLMFHCLEHCPDLRNFSFYACNGPPIYITNEGSIRLMKNLKHADLNVEVDTDYHLKSGPDYKYTILPPLPTTANLLSLTSLVINDSSVTMRILQHCPSLKHLYLTYPRNQSLQIIFQILVNLQSLILYDLEDCTNDGFLGSESFQGGGYSISRLRELKFLAPRCPDDYDLFELDSERILCELQCSRLEYLLLEIPDFELTSTLSQAINRLASNSPAITSLVLSTLYDINGPSAAYANNFFEIVLEFCKHLKSLHYLRVKLCLKTLRKTYNVTKKSMELFEVCPSLRYI